MLAYTWGYGPHSFSLATAAPTDAQIQARLVRTASHAMLGEHETVKGPLLVPSVDVTVGADVRFDFHVTNNSARKLELNFASGETHDVVVIDAGGQELWRWSTGQLFTQSLRNQPLDAHQTLSYTVHWNHPMAHGPLTVIATLTSQNHPLESRAAFTLPLP
jgi:hypothetical protein